MIIKHRAWYDAPHTAHIPGGETLDELRARGEASVNELATRHAGQSIVLVGHTIINRIILLSVLRLGNERFWRLRQDTCAINVFEVDVQAGDCTVVSLNDTCHLRTGPGSG
ncbi:MAG: histidine phosphatase family protein [Thermoflexales bacterium]|nr:histidine phosphatase family protein [Thermoflexales bacterium]